MSITAHNLSKSGAKGKHLDNIVRNQLSVIDDQLQRAERTWGRNIIPCNLPVNFAIPGLLKADGQRIIYTAIIRNLQERGFKVRLLLDKELVVLYVEWVTDISQEEVAAMNKLIKSVRIAPNDVDKYLNEETAPVPTGSLREKKTIIPELSALAPSEEE